MSTAPIELSFWRQLVRFGFRLLYNELAWTYDAVASAVSLGHWVSWQETALEYIDPDSQSRILEIAHGTGNLQRKLLSDGVQIYGLDISPYMGRIARRKVYRSGFRPSLTLGSALSLPFPSESLDFIITTFPTSFFIHPSCLGESYRVLRSTGRIVVVPGARLTLVGIIPRFIEWLFRITGQREGRPDVISARFKESGFSLKIVSHPLPGSDVTILIADKRPGD